MDGETQSRASRLRVFLTVVFKISQELTVTEARVQKRSCVTHFWLASHTSLMLEKRWWCSVLVMVSLSSAEFLNMRIRISRLCRYECSEEMTSNMA